LVSRDTTPLQAARQVNAVVRPWGAISLGGDRMGYPPATDPAFLDRVADWIAARGEVLAIIRYSHKAGAKDFEFFQSADTFRDRLRQLSPRDCVTVFALRQVPLRGRADDDFIRRAAALVPDGVEFLVVGLERVQYGNLSWYPNSAGETHAELRESLADVRGELVAVGTYPPWLEDGVNVASAVIPNHDGSVTTGVY
jgi:hypothetical protein